MPNKYLLNKINKGSSGTILTFVVCLFFCLNDRFNWNSMSEDEQARLKGISLHLLAQVH